MLVLRFGNREVGEVEHVQASDLLSSESAELAPQTMWLGQKRQGMCSGVAKLSGGCQPPTIEQWVLHNYPLAPLLLHRSPNQPNNFGR